MCIFKKKQPTIMFEEDVLDSKYDEMMAWIKDLSRKDYNKLKKAMDSGYDAYQILHGIEPSESDAILNESEFILHEKEGK